MNSNTIKQAIELGFDFDQFDENDNLRFVKQELLEFLFENRELLPQEEDECEVRTSSRGQNVSYGDYVCSGEIVNFKDYLN